jgi:Co/Zn/Cd efflux system component
MHSSSLDPWTHEHVFLGVGHASNERRTWLVVGLTATMMVAEIVGGIVFGSMALLADGWHMSTHAAALAIAALAYQYARHHKHDPLCLWHGEARRPCRLRERNRARHDRVADCL